MNHETSTRPQQQATVRSSVRVVKQRAVGSTLQAPENDYLAIEDPLEINWYYGGESCGIETDSRVSMRTPGHDLELIYGYLFCEGIIQTAADILDIQFDSPKAHAAPTRARVQLRLGLRPQSQQTMRNTAVHSSCGVCGTSQLSQLQLSPELRIQDETQIEVDWIHSLPAQMRQEQDTFRKTGGLHAAAIFSSVGALLASREDIGRHNALDKAIGANLIAGLAPCSGQVLCVSGRMSYEILQKALVARIPIIAGIGAPSSLAVSLANDFNITLIGFVRDSSYNIYSCPERLISR